MLEEDIVSRTDTPPLRFAMVEDHPPLYRGSYPVVKNLHFLQRLRLKTIVSITPEPLGEEVATWCSAQGVQMMHLKTSKETKSKKRPISYWDTKQAIQVLRHFKIVYSANDR
jgi:tyrosine-protein phosphatase OCA6